MTINLKNKAEIIAKYGKNAKDTGSVETQIALLTEKITELTEHLKINDLTGGYNIWTKKALTEIGLDNIIAKGYMFQIEMKFLAETKNLKIVEYPIKFRPRIEGESKMDLKICLEALFKIWKLKTK